MIKREIEAVMKELASGYPALAVTGPRQSGKTTLAKHAFPDKPYVSLENPDVRELAQHDPRGFLEKYSEGAVLDEIQNCPALFSYLQEIMDSSRKMGRFILTGSQQFGLFSGITQSLVGRIAMIQLLPFACTEIYGSKPPALQDTMFRGFYPPVHDRKLNPTLWYANYIQTYIERDVRKMINVRDLNTCQRFIRLCAGRVGQLLNLSQLAADAGVAHNTVRAWISILEASYIVFLLPPHHRNFNKRIIKTPKLYFYDTGLVCWLLAIQKADQIMTHPQRGALFENLAIGEMVKARFNRGLTSNLYFWRDRAGNEVDVIIEKADGLIPVEIKSGQTLNSDYFKDIDHWLKLTHQRQSKSWLVYGGSEEHRQDQTQVLSWRNLGLLKDLV